MTAVLAAVRAQVRRRARDPRHHTCVDRQTYHAMGALLLGWAAAWALGWLEVPGWLSVALLVVALVAIPALTLAWDTEERRRAALTEADKAAGRW